jgi:GNAT superfamily N-acetyltransferase
VGEANWLRCRALSFLNTQDDDDVKQRRTPLTDPSTTLAAAIPTPVDDTVIGILDIEIRGDAATIGTVATHPDHHHTGVATAPLQVVLSMVDDLNVVTLDAWIREDAGAPHSAAHSCQPTATNLTARYA